jgi:LSD1 subclass zinc finger protein
MSFVHCPGCRRAYDLRRGASCPRCAAPEVSRAAARPEPAARPVDERIADLVAELARLVESASATELSAAQRKLAALPELGAARLLSRPDPSARPARSAALALVRASISHTMLRALGSARQSAGGSEAARQVLRAAEQVSSTVSRAVSGSRRRAGAVVRGLRAALSP